MAKIPALTVIYMSAGTSRLLGNVLRFKLANRSPTVRYIRVVDAGSGLGKYTKFPCECFYKLSDAFFSFFRFLRSVLGNRELKTSRQLSHTSAITFWFFSSFFAFSSGLRIFFCPVELVASSPPSSCRAVFMSRASERLPIMGTNFSPPNIAAWVSSKRGPRVNTGESYLQRLLPGRSVIILSVHSNGKVPIIWYTYIATLWCTLLWTKLIVLLPRKTQAQQVWLSLATLGKPPTSERDH